MTVLGPLRGDPGICASLDEDGAVEGDRTVFWANELQDCYIRPLAWRGAESVFGGCPGCAHPCGDRGLGVATPASQGKGTTGLRMRLADWRAPFARNGTPASKCSGLYMIGTLARHAIAEDGYDDAVMLDAQGNVAETTATNIVLLSGDTLISPRPDCFLDSITKHHVFGLARRLGLKVEEAIVSLDMLAAADEVFVTGTSVEVLPVVELSMSERVMRWPVGEVTGTDGDVRGFHPPPSLPLTRPDTATLPPPTGKRKTEPCPAANGRGGWHH